MNDEVNHPSHYTSHPGGRECIEFTCFMSFNVGNAFKYLWRAGLKGDEHVDLQKALFYLKAEQEQEAALPWLLPNKPKETENFSKISSHWKPSRQYAMCNISSYGYRQSCDALANAIHWVEIDINEVLMRKESEVD